MTRPQTLKAVCRKILRHKIDDWSENLPLKNWDWIAYVCGKVMQPLREASSAVDNDDDKLLPQHCLYRRRRNAVIERRNGQGDGSPRKVQEPSLRNGNS
ncbi:hypothetical protein V8E54_005119 [Elaphomyces granulatus]